MKTLYNSPYYAALQAALDFRTAGQTAKANAMQHLADQPRAIWLGDWTKDVTKMVNDAVTAAGSTQIAVFVAYNIPQRDGTDYSAGGALDTVAYWKFIAQIAAGVKRRECWVVLEPDALAHVDFLIADGVTPEDALNQPAFAKRIAMLSAAVDTLTAAGAKVFIDAGSYNWVPASVMVPRLIAAGVARAAGFCVNPSDSETTANSVRFANEVREGIRYKTGVSVGFVVDVGRNGAGAPAGGGEAAWCNPSSLRIGAKPTLVTGIPNCRGLLWIKPPGESDGTCNGGPSAGTWWLEGALRLSGL